jgi:type 1 fimbriae regulatory protein FimB/type 1 fimbriae regulatory protein FimE
MNRQIDETGLELKAHPQMLCHACGYALASKGHDTRAMGKVFTDSALGLPSR